MHHHYHVGRQRATVVRMSTFQDDEDLGAGFRLRFQTTADDTTRVTLVHPGGSEETLVGGYEHESPEDMTWDRDLEDLFRAGLMVGKHVGATGPTYADGVRSGVKRAAAWLREHGDDDAYCSDRTCNCGDFNSVAFAPDPDKLADALDRMADEGEGV
jgi:hypothetical protein